MATELYQLRIGGTHTIQPFENVLYFVGENLNAGDVVVNAKDLIDAFTASPLGSYLDLLPASVQVTRLTAKRQDVGGGIEVVHQQQLGVWVGQVSGGAESDQLCPIIRFIPPMGVKSAGRIFLPAIAEADIQANVPVASWFTRVSALMTTLLAGFDNGTGITWTLAIRSIATNTFHKAVSFDNSPIVGWQKRRRRPV